GVLAGLPAAARAGGLDPDRHRPGRPQPADRPEAPRRPRPPLPASTIGGRASGAVRPAGPGRQARRQPPRSKGAGERGCSSEEREPAAAWLRRRERARQAASIIRSTRHSQKASDDLSFTVCPGHVTGFLGPNGAGKTTNMKIILGLEAQTCGTA